MAITWSKVKREFVKRTTRKDIYVFCSVVLCTFLFACCINDFIAYMFTEETRYATQPYAFLLLVLHVLSFFFAILGFVYMSQVGQSFAEIHAKVVVAVFSVVFNFLTFVIRATMEVVFKYYRHEFYLVAQDDPVVSKSYTDGTSQ